MQKKGVVVTLPTNGTGAALMMLDHGYTGHEHLAEVGLIHMNGRLYDPVLRSFLMPDNFIQQPENTQNYNRYAYVLNNPLMYTDPSGEYGIEIGIAVGIGIAALSYTMTALLTDVPFSIAGLAKAVFVGAVTAGCTFGIGEASNSLFGAASSISKAAFQAVVHGAFQGMMSIEGGKFWSSFAAGALSSIAGSAYGWDGNGAAEGLGWGDSVRNTDVGMIAFGGVSGGAGAALTGGNFWQGAVIGLIVSGINHTMHKMQENKSFREQLKAKEIEPDGKFGFTSKEFEDNINAVKELRVLASKVDSKISSYDVRDAIVGDNGAQAYGESTMMEDNSWKVSLSMSKIKTNLDFVYTIGEEFTHISNMANMTYTTFNSMTDHQRYQEELNTKINFNQRYGDPHSESSINYYRNLLKKQ